MEFLEELSTRELKSVDGGENIIEYAWMGICYCAAKFVMNVPETSPSMGRL